MSDSSEETASLDFLSEDDEDEEEFWEQETMASSGDGGSSCDCNTSDRYADRCFNYVKNVHLQKWLKIAKNRLHFMSLIQILFLHIFFISLSKVSLYFD
jgi:hypothetical protein